MRGKEIGKSVFASATFDYRLYIQYKHHRVTKGYSCFYSKHALYM